MCQKLHLVKWPFRTRSKQCGKHCWLVHDTKMYVKEYIRKNIFKYVNQIYKDAPSVKIFTHCEDAELVSEMTRLPKWHHCYKAAYFSRHWSNATLLYNNQQSVIYKIHTRMCSSGVCQIDWIDISFVMILCLTSPAVITQRLTNASHIKMQIIPQSFRYIALYLNDRYV